LKSGTVQPRLTHATSVVGYCRMVMRCGMLQFIHVFAHLNSFMHFPCLCFDVLQCVAGLGRLLICCSVLPCIMCLCVSTHACLCFVFACQPTCVLILVDYSTALQHTAKHCNILQHTAIDCVYEILSAHDIDVLQVIVVCCSVLQCESWCCVCSCKNKKEREVFTR